MRKEYLSLSKVKSSIAADIAVMMTWLAINSPYSEDEDAVRT